MPVAVCSKNLSLSHLLVARFIDFIRLSLAFFVSHARSVSLSSIYSSFFYGESVSRLRRVIKQQAPDVSASEENFQCTGTQITVGFLRFGGGAAEIKDPRLKQEHHMPLANPVAPSITIVFRGFRRA